MDIERAAFVEGNAGVTLVAGLAIGLEIFAVDGFCQDTGTGSFSHTAWTAEQKGMRKLVIADGVFECGGNVGLSYYCRKVLWSVFTGRNDKILHIQRLFTKAESTENSGEMVKRGMWDIITTPLLTMPFSSG